MAYTPKVLPIRPGPGHPGLIWCYCNNSAAETNIALKVPWSNVELVYAYTYVTAAIDATGACEVDLELNAAGGTELASAQIAKSAAVGTIDEFTFVSTARTPLSNKNSINVEIDGSAAAAGGFMLYLYFEPAMP
ncbi:MAG: hypothetical protein ACXABD_14650 [Candidatus Thorarchaeota archaeon]